MNINKPIEDYIHQVLYESNCPIENYTGTEINVIEKDFISYYDDKKTDPPFPIKDISECLYKLATTDRGWYPQIEVEYDGINASHCGYTDLYPEVEEKLRNVLFTGMPFKFSGSSKKEIGGFSLSRILKDGDITITAYQSIDEGNDLVSDALDDITEMSEDDFYKLCDEALEIWGEENSSEAEDSIIISGSSTYEEILEKVEELQDTLSSILHNSFEEMKLIVKSICEA